MEGKKSSADNYSYDLCYAWCDLCMNLTASSRPPKSKSSAMNYLYEYENDLRSNVLCLFSFFPMPLIPLKYPSAQSFHQPANRMNPQKRGVPYKPILPCSAVVRHEPLSLISRYSLLRARSPPPFVLQA